jgi:glutamate 5-kinase
MNRDLPESGQSEALPSREQLTRARRIVVKIGSRAIAQDPTITRSLARQLSTLLRAGKSPVLVSSGATALGMKRLGMTTKPSEIPLLQAAASAGQSVLMRLYDEAFDAEGALSAQVLLTHSDLADRERVNNARAALSALIDAHVVPIINENDVVATEELRFSDNDQLAAMVAPLVGADALVLLTDVDGVLDESGQRIAVLDDLSAFRDQGSLTPGIGRGGMSSKVSAAAKGRRSGAAVVIAKASEPDIVLRILAGEDLGTYFPARGGVLRARQHWIAYTLRPVGTVLIDDGAVEALRGGERSLLPVGVLGIRGEFHAGDAVRVVDIHGTEVARGLSRLSSQDVARVAGKQKDELMDLVGSDKVIVVHRDDMVIGE